MTTFNINLIRDRTPSEGRRRTVFWGLTIYLILCTAALAAVANHATRRLVETRRLRARTARIEQQFRSRFPGAGDVLAYAQASGRDMQRLVARLETIDLVLANRINLTAILSGLAAPLPRDIHLLSVQLDDGGRTLLFDVAVPAGPLEERISPGSLTAVWNDDETLVRRVGRIRSTATQRHRIDSRPVVLLRFACDLPGEDS